MPRGGRRSASPIRRSSPPPVSRAPAPVRSAPPAPAAAPSKGPGLFGQMAATAGGVAIGSAVGHTVGNMLSGGGGGGGEVTEAPAPVPQQQQQQAYQQPCEFELRQFFECSQNQHDLSLCEGFNQALKECRLRAGMV